MEVLRRRGPWRLLYNSEYVIFTMFGLFEGDVSPRGISQPRPGARRSHLLCVGKKSKTSTDLYINHTSFMAAITA